MQTKGLRRLAAVSASALAVGALAAMLATSITACGGPLESEGFPSCGDDSGVECPPTPCTASKVTYHCQFGGTGVNAVDVPVCLPSNLNLAIASPTEQTAINSMCEAGTYDKAVFDYGQQVLKQVGALFALDTNGGACDKILAALQDGGVGDSGLPLTFCNEEEAGTNIGFCEDAGTFAPTTCCPTLDDAGRCQPNPCYGFAGGTINPHGCPCNTVPLNPDECNIEAGTVVIPPPGQADPPNESSGLLQRFLSVVSTATMDSASSYATGHLHFTDTFNAGHDDTQTSRLSGTVSIYGRPRADGTAGVYFDGFLHGTDLHFHFSGVDVLGNVDLSLTNVTIALGGGDNLIELDSYGIGTIPKQSMSLTLEAVINGQPTIVRRTNDNAISIQVDFGAKTFAIPSFTFSPFGADVTVALSGTLTNQPPLAVAGPDQTVECTSPHGANVTLQGAVSDPDNESPAISWLQGPPISQGEISLFNHNLFVGDTATLNVLAPFSPPMLTTGYTLVAQDHTLQTSPSQMTVTVQDTTPPVLSLTVTPDCLWPPNHSMVLYQFGDGLTATSEDTCDSDPKTEIVAVSSDQPPLGGGSGDVAPDVVFGHQAFCVRAERDGRGIARHYTVSVKATDTSGNATTSDVVIVVDHAQGGVNCPNVPSDRVVDVSDPRCSAN